FGEVALLRSVPRTASVRACAPTVLFSLDRDAFQRLVQQADGLRRRLDREVDTRYHYLPGSLLLHH
ncbi:MAG: cyclic nucleotide-binding domain-containing protein, partial [Chloroflexi bacterium]|nr:cyclic nucleotide-binding domain-containing protein [Chloroflexota bacterium]